MSVQYEDKDGIVQTMKTRAKTTPINLEGDLCPKLVNGKSSVIDSDEECLSIFENTESVLNHVSGLVTQILITERISNEDREEIKKEVLRGIKKILPLVLREKNIVKLNNTIQGKVLDLLREL